MKNLNLAIEEAKICQENIDTEIKTQYLHAFYGLTPFINKMVAVTLKDKAIVKGVIPDAEPLSIFNSTLRLVVHLHRPGENKPITRRRRVIPVCEIENIDIYGEYKPEVGRENVRETR